MDQIIKQSLPQKFSKHIGNVMTAYNVVTLLKDKIYPEYQEIQNAKSFQVDPMEYSCIFEGQQQQEKNKRTAQQIKIKSMENIEKFIDQVDITLELDSDKITELCFDEKQQCLLINLDLIRDHLQDLCLTSNKSKEQQLSQSLDELAKMLLDYLKGEFILNNVQSEFQFHILELRDFVIQKLRKKAKKLNIYKELIKYIQDYAKHQEQNEQLQPLCQTLQQCQAINAKPLIVNFFKSNENEFLDTMRGIYGFNITGVVLQKYYEQIQQYHLFYIKSNLQHLYKYNNQELQQQCRLLFNQYLLNQPINNGIFNEDINYHLQNIIKYSQWDFNQQIYVKQLLLQLTNLVKPKSIIRISQEINQFDFQLQQQKFQDSLSWFNNNIDEQSNIQIIFQLFIQCSGFEFINQQLQVTNYLPIKKSILVLILRKLNNFKFNYINMYILKQFESIQGQYQIQILEQIKNNLNLNVNNYDSNKESIPITLADAQIYLCEKYHQQYQAQIQYFKYNQLLYYLYRPIDKQSEQYIQVVQNQQQQFIKDKLSIIHQNQLLNEKPPDYFFFELISTPNQFSNIITLCISGFVSEDEDKYEQWKGILDQGSIVIALHWKCSTLKEFGKNFVTQIASQAILAQGFSSLTAILTALSIYSDNPFKDAEKEAIKVGKYLAHLIGNQRIFGHYQINIVCHSLGTQVLHDCVRELDKIYQSTKEHYINNVMMMGGVADCDKLAKRRWHCVAGLIYNLYSKKDSIINYLFQIVKIFHKPCGKQKIYLGYRKVININCTRFIDGHKYYKKMMNQILIQTDFDNDFKILFDQTDSNN